MCGIAGILKIHPPGSPPPPVWDAIPESWLDSLDSCITHRGPDGAGRFRDRATRPDGATVDVAFIHRRLSIIDHQGGHQPMVSLRKGAGSLTQTTFPLDDGRGLYLPGEHHLLRSPSSAPADSSLVAVVFNGCIYNHRELRARLQAAGHVFSSDHSDTEVLVHGWREWGPDLFPSLDSMHAVVVWDAAAATLVGSRDFAGEKPLYALWRDDLQLYAFASTVPSLLRLQSQLPPAPSSRPASILPWVRQGWHFMPPFANFDEYGPSQTRAIPGASHLAPRFLVGMPGRIRSIPGESYISPQRLFSEPPAPLTADTVDSLLAAAVASRLDADVPVGCFLSGGVDSSLVAYHASRIRPDIQCFTVRMPSAGFDESEHAQHVARLIGVKCHTLECSTDPAGDLVSLIHQLGLPFGDSSLLPTHWVSRATRQQVTVALTGDGADELFGGYDRYAAYPLMARYGFLLRLVPDALIASRNPRSRLTKLARLVRWAKTGDGPLTIFDDADLHSIFPDAPREGRLAISDNPLVDDFSSYLPYDLLRKVDTASMAVALETRAPFLAADLVNACLGAPLDVLMPRGRRKGLLRDVARRHLPSEVVDRPKMGFAIPIGDWFRTNHGNMRDLLFDHLHAADPFGPPSLLGLQPDLNAIRRMLQEHDNAGAASLVPWKGRDHSQRLYMLLVLSIWAKWITIPSHP